jgi:hypothetical protein
MTTDNLAAFFRHVADFARKNKIDELHSCMAASRC